MNSLFLLGVATLSLMTLRSTTAQTVVLDGRFEDWKSIEGVEDAAGDASSAFDLTTVKATSLGTIIYVHFDFGLEANLQNGKQSEGTLTLSLNWGDDSLEIDFRQREAHLASDVDNRVPWTDLNMVSQPTFAAPQVELRLDLGVVGAEVGDTVTIQFGGSDQLAEPLQVELAGEAPTVNRSAARQEGTSFRLASLNTLNQGSADEERSPGVKRLLAATGANIFCFQEERREDVFKDNLASFMPHAEGETLNSTWSDGCAIATTWELKPVDLGLDRGVAAAVTTPEGEKIVVVSVHLKCCGYSGSSEDELRIEQAGQLKEGIAKLREGELGDDLTESAVIIVGDYNLVGSREPLTVIESAGLQEWLLMGLNDNATTTWRGRPQESFWPGRLDALTYDKERLATKNGFLMDTARLTDDQLVELKVEAEDSSVSDHLMIVADFEVKE